MHDATTHLLLTRGTSIELAVQAAEQRRASRVTRLRRLDRRAERAAARARLLRQVL